MPDVEQPRMIIEPGAEPAAARRIGTIDGSIHRNPELFTEAMRSLGEQATNQVIDTSDIAQRTPTASRKPSMLIQEFLNNRYDLDSRFDSATENALKADERHEQLLKSVQSKTPVTVRTGAMSSQTRANREAPSARDELRRYRLSFYLARVAASKAAQPSLKAV